MYPLQPRFLPLLLLLAAAVTAQNPYGRITGRVTDSAGAIVPGAAIRLVQVGTNVPAASTTNNEGNYDLQNLNPGQYRVTVEMQGFKKYERGPIEVRVGDVVALDVSLEVGALTESITVVEEAALLESASSNVGQVIDNRRILDLPLPGGSPMYLMQLAPGIVSTNPPTHGWLPHAVDAVSNLASAGTRTRSSEFTLDGIPNMTQGGQVSFSPPPEMIQEFRVQTAAFDASIGHFSGAHVNMVMKSGANDVHGNLYFLHQSRPLMSRPFFINKSIYDLATGPVTQDKISRFWPPVKTHRYRATASGPVYIPKVYDGRNRTFWTYGLDVLDRTRPESRYSTVPTVEQRQGDFSGLLRLGAAIPDLRPGHHRSRRAGPFHPPAVPRQPRPRQPHRSDGEENPGLLPRPQRHRNGGRPRQLLRPEYQPHQLPQSQHARGPLHQREPPALRNVHVGEHAGHAEPVVSQRGARASPRGAIIAAWRSITWPRCGPTWF